MWLFSSKISTQSGNPCTLKHWLQKPKEPSIKGKTSIDCPWNVVTIWIKHKNSQSILYMWKKRNSGLLLEWHEWRVCLFKTTHHIPQDSMTRPSYRSSLNVDTGIQCNGCKFFLNLHQHRGCHKPRFWVLAATFLNQELCSCNCWTQMCATSWPLHSLFSEKTPRLRKFLYQEFQISDWYQHRHQLDTSVPGESS